MMSSPSSVSSHTTLSFVAFVPQVPLAPTAFATIVAKKPVTSSPAKSAAGTKPMSMTNTRKTDNTFLNVFFNLFLSFFIAFFRRSAVLRAIFLFFIGKNAVFGEIITHLCSIDNICIQKIQNFPLQFF